MQVVWALTPSTISTPLNSGLRFNASNINPELLLIRSVIIFGHGVTNPDLDKVLVCRHEPVFRQGTKGNL